MFAGLMGLDCHSNSLRRRSEVTEGGRASGTAGSSSRKRLHRRPGYMRGEQSRLQSTTQEEEEEEDKRTSCMRKCKNTDTTEAASPQGLSLGPVVKVPSINQQQQSKLTCSSYKSKNFLCSANCSPFNSTPNRPGQSSLQQNELSLSPSLALQSEPDDSFNSSFSFIQQSISSCQGTTTTPARRSEPLNTLTKPEILSIQQRSLKQSSFVHSLPAAAAPVNRVEEEEQPSGGRLWRECLWAGNEETVAHLRDCETQSPDIEVISSLSVDSDTASASSVTSGYESSTPASEQGWDSLVKKYEGVLQDCLQSNRTHAKIESMMLKLQRLQQKAILDDDYDAAERFGKKLEELCRERDALKLGLPSKQPTVALFLDRLTQVVHSALQREDCGQCRESAESDAAEQSDSSQGRQQRREHLIQEKRHIQEEMAELEQRLSELKDRSRCLEQQIQQEEQRVEVEELEGSVLRSCTTVHLRHMSRILQDLVTSENRAQISVSRPPSMLRLQEQEQALNLSIKEATAKVVISQRLGSSLRRKVSEAETQLLTLHEAKLAAISGNDFSSAKELKAEMKAVYLEQDRLEALTKRLHSLSSGSSKELSRMKQQRQQLRQELEHREAQHEHRLKENTTKYIELLEDRLHSCGCPGLERIWEADLEACHLFLRGLQLRTPSCSGADIEDLPSSAGPPASQPCTKEEEDCAMLTALGGRWCPEANLQNSEFTKKLEEFLFCMEDNHPEDSCSDAEATDLTERCELISERLMTLEDELQTAILNRDQALTHSLEKEVQEVKSTLQTMLTQLKVEEEDEEEVNEMDDIVNNGIEDDEEEEKEDQYFSDSWDI
ncbi:disrupted in schizophrenia 1 protein [Pholidichthys leucotaenia]